MCTIRMKSKTKQFGTAVPNIFIDRYMNELDGSFIRVYLYMLRHYTGSNPDRRDSAELSVATMADRLRCMESDIHRALRELMRVGLLDVSFDEQNRVTGIELVDLFDVPYEPLELSETVEPYDVPARAGAGRSAQKGDLAESSAADAPAPAATADPASDDAEEETAETPDYDGMEKAFSVTNEIQDRFEKDPAYSGLTDLLEQLLNAPMSPELYRLMLFAYDGLRFPKDLVIFLFDYCIELQKANPKYMRKVAINWAENGISSEKEAQQFVLQYDTAIRAVMDQFGLRQSLGKGQVEYIRRWSREWNMPVALIEEACRRTMSSIGKPSFPYAEKVLKAWIDAGFTTIEEIRSADETRTRKSPRAGRRTADGASDAPKNAFNSGYEQREYTEEEYSALELAMRKRH